MLPHLAQTGVHLGPATGSQFAQTGVPPHLGQRAPHFSPVQAPQQVPTHISQTAVRETAPLHQPPPPPPPPSLEPPVPPHPPWDGFPPLAVRDSHPFMPPANRPPRGEWEEHRRPVSHDGGHTYPPPDEPHPPDAPLPPRSIPTYYRSDRRSPSPRRDRHHSPPGRSGRGRSPSPPSRRYVVCVTLCP